MAVTELHYDDDPASMLYQALLGVLWATWAAYVAPFFNVRVASVRLPISNLPSIAVVGRWQGGSDLSCMALSRAGQMAHSSQSSPWPALETSAIHPDACYSPPRCVALTRIAAAFFEGSYIHSRVAQAWESTALASHAST